MSDIPEPIPKKSEHFAHALRRSFRDRGYSYKTEQTYIHWIKRFIFYHKKQHPQLLRKNHVNAFFIYFGSVRHCSSGTQRVALNALIYLYGAFLQFELEPLIFEKARRQKRLSVVLTHIEVKPVLRELKGKYLLMVELLYGSGLGQNELLSLRIKDLDFETAVVTVRSGKGDKDRTTLLVNSMLPESGPVRPLVCIGLIQKVALIPLIPTP